MVRRRERWGWGKWDECVEGQRRGAEEGEGLGRIGGGGVEIRGRSEGEKRGVDCRGRKWRGVGRIEGVTSRFKGYVSINPVSASL